jgi:hypothetical protein
MYKVQIHSVVPQIVTVPICETSVIDHVLHLLV